MVNRVLSAINRGVAGLLTRAIDLLYIGVVSRVVSRETMRYFVCGVLNYIVLDAVLYYMIYHYIIDVSYIYIGALVISPHVASMVVVFPITFLTGFWLNRYVAFKAVAPKKSKQMVRYGISVGGSIVLSYVVLKVLVEVVGLWATPAKVLCSVTTALYSYLMARFFTFQNKI